MFFQESRFTVAIVEDVSLKPIQKSQTVLELPTPKFVKFALLATPLGQ